MRVVTISLLIPIDVIRHKIDRRQMGHVLRQMVRESPAFADRKS